MKAGKINIEFTENDLQELIEGKEFNWNYPDLNGKGYVEVHLYKAK
jgi:hypothetical protein